MPIPKLNKASKTYTFSVTKSRIITEKVVYTISAGTRLEASEVMKEAVKNDKLDGWNRSQNINVYDVQNISNDPVTEQTDISQYPLSLKLDNEAEIMRIPKLKKDESLDNG